MKKRSLFGQGLSFPPRVGPDGRLAWSMGEQNVRESIRLILMTVPGERLMRERFGCGLRQFLFEPNTVTTRELIRQRIVQAVSRWEPRVRVQEVLVEEDPVDPRIAAVTIYFQLVATQAVEQLDLTLMFEN
jgi:phage baseplate assembly protein W